MPVDIPERGHMEERKVGWLSCLSGQCTAVAGGSLKLLRGLNH